MSLGFFLAFVGIAYLLLFGTHCHILRYQQKTMERITAVIYFIAALAYGSLAYAEFSPHPKPQHPSEELANTTSSK